MIGFRTVLKYANTSTDHYHGSRDTGTRALFNMVRSRHVGEDETLVTKRTGCFTRRYRNGAKQQKPVPAAAVTTAATHHPMSSASLFNVILIQSLHYSCKLELKLPHRVLTAFIRLLVSQLLPGK